MKKFKIPSCSFYINGFFRINGDISLSNKTPANDVGNRIINTLLIKIRIPELEIFIFDINGWVDEQSYKCDTKLSSSCIILQYKKITRGSTHHVEKK